MSDEEFCMFIPIIFAISFRKSILPYYTSKFKFVIYRVKSIQLFALLFYDEGDWPTEFQIGTPRPEKNVLASLHYSAFDSASWDIAPV